MATNHAEVTAGETGGSMARLGAEHLSLFPLSAAGAAVLSGAEWSWPAAAAALGVAYLFAYAGARR